MYFNGPSRTAPILRRMTQQGYFSRCERNCSLSCAKYVISACAIVNLMLVRLHLHVHARKHACMHARTRARTHGHKSHQILFPQHDCSENLEWLLAVHPRVLDDIPTSDFLISVPKNARTLEMLATRTSIASIVEVLEPMALLKSFYFAPAVVRWCMNHGGMHFDQAFFHRMLSSASKTDNATDMEQFLLLGGVWRVEYFRTALANEHLKVCKWAHARGDLTIDFTFSDAQIWRLSKHSLMWLASMLVRPGAGTNVPYLLLSSSNTPLHTTS